MAAASPTAIRIPIKATVPVTPANPPEIPPITCQFHLSAYLSFSSPNLVNRIDFKFLANFSLISVRELSI
jgi:hypothetical protein